MDVKSLLKRMKDLGTSQVSSAFNNNAQVKGLKVLANSVQNTPQARGLKIATSQPAQQFYKDYYQGNIQTPEAQGVQQMMRPGVSNKAWGAAQIAMTAFAPLATPFNAAAGVLRSLRTGEPMQESLYRGITNPTSIASEGFGVKNPYVAMGIDVLATRNPKSIIKDPLLLKSLGQNVTRAKALFSNPGASLNTLDIPGINYKRVEDLIDHAEGAPDRKRVEFYKNQIQSGQPIAPLYLIKEGGKFGVEDGKHRLQAMKELGIRLVPGIEKKNLTEETMRLINGHLDSPTHSPAMNPSMADDFDIPKMGFVADTPKYAGSINTERLTVSTPAKVRIAKQVESIAPDLEKVKGSPLTQVEVQEAAENSAVLQKVVTREQSKTMQAGLLKARERMVTLDAEIQRAQASGNTGQVQRLTKELIQTIKVVNSQAADAGRKLGSFRINAKEQPFRDRVLDQISKRVELTDSQLDEMAAKAAQVNWNNANEVVAFYRGYIQPSFGEMMNEYRYMNLLSSPRTHIINAFSNAIQTTITRPATKLASGVIDPIASVLTGKAQEHYLTEVPHYYRGMFGAIPEAFQKVRDVFTGKVAISNLDVDHLPSGTMLSKGNIVTKGLEASDQFFRTLIEGAEKQALGNKFTKMGKQVGQADIDQLATQAGQYTTFRQPLDPQNAGGQGHVLSTIDKATKAIMGLRKVPGMGWFLPFVQTPMNILKQGVEYSPLGFGTLPGAADKSEQLGKAMVGSMVFAGAGYLALQDKLSWAAPKDKEQRDAFHAAGRQAYAVKIGNKWVSYSKLGPLAYPLAMAAALKYAYEDDPNAAANGADEKALAGLSGIMGFFADQSYMQGIGDMIKTVEGREGFNLTKLAGNVATQYIPMSSLLRWTAQIVDPIYRKGETIGENIAKGIPILSNSTPYYENPMGEPSRRQSPGLNAFSPVGITEERPEYEQLYQQRQEELEQNAIVKREEKEIEKALKEDVAGNTASADEGSAKPGDLLAAKQGKFQEELASKRVKMRGGYEEANGKLIYANENGDKESVNIGQFNKAAEGFKKYTLEADKATEARKLYGATGIPDKVKDTYYKKLGLSSEEVEYDYLANQEVAVRAGYITETLGEDHDTMIESLAEMRRESLSGDRVASDGVLDELYDDGLISYAERKELKAIKLDRQGKAKAGGTGKGKKLKIGATPKVSGAVKVASAKQRQIKLQTIKPPKTAALPTISLLNNRRKPASIRISNTETRRAPLKQRAIRVRFGK